jgi:type IV pilus secretin PilQ/predicted competence protein
MIWWALNPTQSLPARRPSLACSIVSAAVVAVASAAALATHPTARAQAANPAPGAPTAAPAAPVALQSVSLQPGDGGSVRLLLQFDRALAGTPTGFVSASPPRAVIDLPGVRNALGRESLTLQQGLLLGASLAEAGERTRLVLALREPAQWRVVVEGRSATVQLSPRSATASTPPPPRSPAAQAAAEAARVAPAQEAPAAPRPAAAVGGAPGDRISLNFQNIEVRALLQLIADFTQINIVASDSVAGNLTLRLHDVPWEQALDLILQSRGLGQRRSGNVMRVAPLAELNAQDQAELEAQRKLADLEPLRTQAFQLNYAKADDVARSLGGGSGPAPGPALAAAGGAAAGPAAREGAAGRLLSPRGSLLAEPRTNQLFVTDIASRLEQVQALIRRVDVPVRQVLIEARIVEADDSFGRALGVRLGLNDQRTPPGVPLGGGNRVAIGSSYSPNATFSDSAFVNLPAPTGALGAGSAATFALSLFGASANRFLNLELSALEADGRGRIVSSPRVITADKVKATIEQGDELPFQVATSSGATSVQFKKASLRLEVVPQITPDGQVILEVDVNKDSPGIETKSGFSINTKHVKTQVLVENGGTVLIGGIYTQTESESTAKVPGLGDLPGVGNLFRNRTRSVKKTELMVFLTPRLVSEANAAR